MTNELVKQESNSLMLTPVMNIEVAKQRLAVFQEFVRDYLVEGEDYGTIPGTQKPTLYKPGSDKLCELYGIADTYEVTNRVEDWEKNLFDYEIKCILLSKRDGMVVSTGIGSCNSYESRYRWRNANRSCPVCGAEAIIKGKEEYGGGWLCHKKQGGCGRKWKDDDEVITNQKVGKVLNDDIPTLKNTLIKMAKKRAKIDATLAATRSSGIFTQDIEDLPNSSVVTENKEASEKTNGKKHEPNPQQSGSYPEPIKQALKPITQALETSVDLESLKTELVRLTNNHADLLTKKQRDRVIEITKPGSTDLKAIQKAIDHILSKVPIDDDPVVEEVL